MRRSSFALSFVAVTALVGTAFAAETLKLPWDGYGEGSFVLMKTTTKTVMSGGPAEMPAMPEQVSEMRQTLVKITDKAYTIKSEIKVGDTWMPSEYDMPRVATDATKPEQKPEELGNEKLTVEGVEIDCKKQKMVVMGSTTISWTSEKYGLVKSETTGGQGDLKINLTKLKSTAKVKGKDVECRELTTTMKSEQMEMTSTTWTSDAIPGGSARVESTSKMKMGEMTSTTTTTQEVADFEKK
jgi:hypothetical protein